MIDLVKSKLILKEFFGKKIFKVINLFRDTRLKVVHGNYA